MSTFRCSWFALTCLVASSAYADFVVDTIADEDANNGSCSLREAIKAVNQQADYNGCSSATIGEQHVSFALPSETITLGSSLPPITRQIFIDGTTQGPAVCTLPPSVHVHLVGSGNVSDAGDGLEFATGSDGSVVKGLALSGFGATDEIGNARSGILIESTNVTVGCNVLQNNTYGVNVQAAGAVIGVANASEWLPNLISGNLYNDVYILGGDDAVISGNYIGVDATGLAAMDGGGILVAGGDNVHVGFHVDDGSELRQRNVIAVHAPAGHAANDVTLTSTHTVLAGNYIGIGADGHTAIPLGIGYVVVLAGDSNLVGCDGSGSWDYCRNVIAGPSSGSTIAGVVISGTNNAVVSNFIGTAADGKTTLGGNIATIGVWLDDGNGLVARNVINVGSQGFGVELIGSSKTPVFLNKSDGLFLDSGDNCIDGDYYGLYVESAPTLPNIFANNWWGAADGPSAPQASPPVNAAASTSMVT